MTGPQRKPAAPLTPRAGTMLVWAGTDALSTFRLDKLLEAIRSRVPRVSRIAARHEHCLSIDRPLTDSEERTLRRLLGDEPVRP